MPPLGSTSLLSHGSEKRTGPRLGRPRGLRSCPGKWVRFAQRKEPGSAMEPTWADSPTRLTWVRSSRFPGRLGSFLPARSGGGLLAQARRDEVTRAGRQSNRSRIKILNAKPIGAIRFAISIAKLRHFEPQGWLRFAGPIAESRRQSFPGNWVRLARRSVGEPWVRLATNQWPGDRVGGRAGVLLGMATRTGFVLAGIGPVTFTCHGWPGVSGAGRGYDSGSDPRPWRRGCFVVRGSRRSKLKWRRTRPTCRPGSRPSSSGGWRLTGLPSGSRRGLCCSTRGRRISTSSSCSPGRSRSSSIREKGSGSSPGPGPDSLSATPRRLPDGRRWSRRGWWRTLGDPPGHARTVSARRGRRLGVVRHFSPDVPGPAVVPDRRGARLVPPGRLAVFERHPPAS